MLSRWSSGGATSISLDGRARGRRWSRGIGGAICVRLCDSALRLSGCRRRWSISSKWRCRRGLRCQRLYRLACGRVRGTVLIHRLPRLPWLALLAMLTWLSGLPWLPWLSRLCIIVGHLKAGWYLAWGVSRNARDSRCHMLTVVRISVGPVALTCRRIWRVSLSAFL